MKKLSLSAFFSSTKIALIPPIQSVMVGYNVKTKKSHIFLNIDQSQMPEFYVKSGIFG